MITSASFWFTILASTTPVLLATLSAVIVSRAGIFNLGIEGTMSMSALAGVLVSAYSGSLLFGCLAGLATGIVASLLLGYFCLYLKAPFNSVGVAINLVASGGTVFVLTQVTGSKITSSSLVSKVFPTVNIPLIKDIPFIGEVISGHNLITYLSWLFLFGSYYMLFHTKFGLEIRSVGENESAARTAGINVEKTKMLTLVLCGIFSGFGGMYLSMGALRSFTANMVAGRGFLALAMDAMSQGNPLLGAVGALMYGFSETITVYLQLYSDMSVQIIDAFPYVFILVALIIIQFVKRRLRYREKQRIIEVEIEEN